MEQPKSKGIPSDQLADPHRSATDILDPSVNVTEEKQRDPLITPPESPDGLTAEDHARAAEAKKEKYAAEQRAREGVLDSAVPRDDGISRSSVDKGQEAHLSPEAEKALKEGQNKAKNQSKF